MWFYNQNPTSTINYQPSLDRILELGLAVDAETIKTIANYSPDAFLLYNSIVCDSKKNAPADKPIWYYIVQKKSNNALDADIDHVVVEHPLTRRPSDQIHHLLKRPPVYIDHPVSSGNKHQQWKFVAIGGMLFVIIVVISSNNYFQTKLTSNWNVQTETCF